MFIQIANISKTTRNMKFDAGGNHLFLVSQHVVVQQCGVSESFIANFTDKRLQRRMCEHMIFKILQ